MWNKFSCLKKQHESSGGCLGEVIAYEIPLLGGGGGLIIGRTSQ